jgi:hypothetical protein
VHAARHVLRSALAGINNLAHQHSATTYWTWIPDEAKPAPTLLFAALLLHFLTVWFLHCMNRESNL